MFIKLTSVFSTFQWNFSHFNIKEQHLAVFEKTTQKLLFEPTLLWLLWKTFHFFLLFVYIHSCCSSFILQCKCRIFLLKHFTFNWFLCTIYMRVHIKSKLSYLLVFVWVAWGLRLWKKYLFLRLCQYVYKNTHKSTYSNK